MNVAQLKAILETYDDDTIVRFAYDYGDRTHTQVSPEVRKVLTSLVQYSDYHRQHRLVDDEDFDEADNHNDQGEECLILTN